MDVLIVGAGPVGLMLGHELARRGVDHRIVETKEKREPYCKALGVSPRTMELFDQIGVLDEALRRGFHFHSMNVVVGGELVKHFEVQDERSPFGPFALAQPHTEEILENSWARYGNAIVRGKTLQGFEEKADHVVATFTDGESLEARYLVGCDGAHSSVRKILGTSFEGERIARTFLLGDVRLNWDRSPRDNWQFIHMVDGEMRNNVTLIANPTGPGRYRLSTSVDESDDCPEHPSLEYIQNIVRPILPEGVELSDLRWSSRYGISHRIAGSYSTGRVFLAGDAAHIHPPIGGLGMNTGLQDAHNLGWKLAEVCHGHLKEDILDTYDSERRPVGQKVVQITGARMSRAMGEESDVVEPPEFDTQLRVRYEPGLLVGGTNPSSGLPKPGDRLPAVDGLRRPHVHGEFRLAEILRDGRFHLFTHESDRAAFVETAGAHLGERMRDWTIFVSGEPEQAMGSILDPQGRWAEEVGTGAVLVRPDGVIGWRGSSASEFGSWLQGLVGSSESQRQAVAL